MRRPFWARLCVSAGAVAAAVALSAGCSGQPSTPGPAPAAWTPAPVPAAGAPLGPPAVIAPGRPGEPGRLLPGGTGPTGGDVATPADVAFVSMMIPHHEQALVMSGLAPTRAADLRVRAMADRIAGVQGAEIAMLRGWLNRHGGPGAGAPMAGMGAMRGMATPAQLDGLAASGGPAFDRAFLDLMIAHHEGALDMARTAQVDGRDVDALQIADDVVATQTADIARMRAMYPA